LTKLKYLLDKGLAAFLPVYDGGNVTRIITAEGEQRIYPRTSRTVLRNLARYYGVDLVATRKLYAGLINKTHMVPLPLAAHFMLMPIKVRKNPLGQNDGTLGYVNFAEILDVKKNDDNTASIVLKSGVHIPTVLSEITIREYIKNARLVESLYLTRHFASSTVPPLYNKPGGGAASGEFSGHESKNPYTLKPFKPRENHEDIKALRAQFIELLVRILDLQ
jgi:hypothetical protein